MPDYSKTRIQFRRGTAAELSAANPTLGVGEPAFATDTNVLKIGDGSTAYNSLSGITGGGGGGGSSTFLGLSDTPSNFTSASSKFLKVNSSGNALEFVAASPLENVVEDTTPQLGGDLDAQSNDISSVGSITATSLIKSGGTSSQFLKADGSVDTNTYLTSVSNIDTTNFNAATIVTEAEGIGSNDNDTTLPTSAAVKDYADSKLSSDTSAVTNSTVVSNIVQITQANYDALSSYDANTVYIIT